MNGSGKAALAAVAIGIATLATLSTPAGQNRVFTSGLPTGRGTIAEPIDMPVYYDSTFVDGGTGSAGAPLSISDVTQIPLASFGTGIDGNITYAVNTSLTGDVFAENMTVNTGVTVNPDGFRIWVHGTLTLSGTASINRNGTTGATGNGSSGSIGGCSQATGGIGLTVSGTLPGGAGNPGCTGSNSTTSPFPSASALAGAVAPAVNAVGNNGTTATAPGLGGSGGSGGSLPAAAGQAGCPTGSIVQTPAIQAASIGDMRLMISGRNESNTLDTIGAGGGGGGCGAAGAGGNVSKGGGTGGRIAGWVVVFAQHIVGTGSISANGGNGGPGGGGSSTSGGGGGGGGGPGGIAVVVIGGGAFPTVTANGGTGGTGSAGSGAGAKVGGNGGDGAPGYAITLRTGF